MLDRHCSLSGPTLPLPLLARVVGRATTLPDSVAKLQPASHLFSELSLYRDAYLLRMPCSFLFWSVRSCFYLALVAIEHPRLRLYRCRGGVSSKIGIRQPQSNHIEMDPLQLLGILGNLLSPWSLSLETFSTAHHDMFPDTYRLHLERLSGITTPTCAYLQHT